MRVLKKLIATIAIFLLLFLAAGIVVSFLFGDEVREALVSGLNKSLKTEIEVGDIRFSVLRKFPNASLEFRDVLIKSSKGFRKNEFMKYQPDTLLWADKLFLEFSLRSLVTGRYTVTSFQAQNAYVNILIDQQGRENFRFWDYQPDSEQVDFKIDLHDFRFVNSEILFADASRHLVIHTGIGKLHLEGNFSARQYRLSGISDLQIISMIMEEVQYLSDLPLRLAVDIDVDGDLFKLGKGFVDIGKMRFMAEGEYYGAGINRIDFQLVGDNLNIKMAESFLSGRNLELFQEYSPQGSLFFNAGMKGRYGRHESPIVQGDFAIRDGGFQRKGSKTRVHHLVLKGSFSNGRLASPLSSWLDLESFHGFAGRSELSGNMKVENLANPYLRGNIFFEGNLLELADIYMPEEIVHISGEVKTAILVNGYYERLKNLTAENMVTVFPEIKAEVNQGRFTLRNEFWNFDEINGRVLLAKNLVFDQLSFRHHGNRLLLSGELTSAQGNVFKKGGNLTVKGNIHSPYFKLDVLMPDPEKRSDDKKVLVFPERLNMELLFSCNEFIFRNFSAREISGMVNYKPRMFMLNSVKMASFGGDLSGGGAIIQKMNHDFLFQAQTNFKNIDISQLFFSFEDFKQDFIGHRHLKGDMTGDLNFISEWNNDFEMKVDETVADGKISLAGGELINFEPMNSLSRFIEVEELQHVRFSNLQNEIFIRNRMVTIPKMDIQSSAFNISLSGTHDFDNLFNYRLRVLLSDVLFNRARNAKKENERYGIVEDDGLGRTSLYLMLSGNPDDYKISYDRRAVSEVVRQGLEEEKVKLRQMFNDEFGWFSRDSGQKRMEETKSPRPAYRIEWDEDEKKENQPARRSTGKEQDKKTFRITWEEEEKPDSLRKK